jgi:hypothetical protein
MSNVPNGATIAGIKRSTDFKTVYSVLSATQINNLRDDMRGEHRV